MEYNYYYYLYLVQSNSQPWFVVGSSLQQVADAVDNAFRDGEEVSLLFESYFMAQDCVFASSLSPETS